MLSHSLADGILTSLVSVVLFFFSSLISIVHQKWCHSSYLEAQVWKRMCQKWLLFFLYSCKAYQLFGYTFLHTVSMDLTKAVMYFNFQHWHLFTKKFKTIAIEPLRNLAMGVCMLISIFMRHTLNVIFAQLRIWFTNVCVQIHWNVRNFFWILTMKLRQTKLLYNFSEI